MASYTGSAAEGARARTLAHEREEQQASFKRKQAEIKKANEVRLVDMNDAFAAKNGALEEAFKASTVGLVSAADFKRKRIELEAAQQAIEAAKQKAAEKERKRKANEREKKKAALTFSMDDEEEAALATAPATTSEQKSSSADDAAASTANAAASSTAAVATAAEANSSDGADEPASKKQKVLPTLPARSSGKDPLADTSFLPDREREAEEAAYRARLAEEWRAAQELVKQEQIEIVYSYWDGSGHRNKIALAKGTTIGQFLERARKDIAHEFHELRALTGEALMYIKEDLIIPHTYSFYQLIVSKARGKSGPLFHFDVHDDVRMSISANVEKDESHAGKIVTKAWYERNKNNFPASRWEVFDPSVVRDKYTIKGGEVRGAFAPK